MLPDGRWLSPHTDTRNSRVSRVVVAPFELKLTHSIKQARKNTVFLYYDNPSFVIFKIKIKYK